MKTKVKSIIQRIMAGALALVFAGTIALPKAEAITGVDDVSVGIMAVLVHLDSIGGSLAVQQGTALATQSAVTSLADQAAAVGVFGAGVTGAGVLASIGAAVTAFGAGYTIGYVGYEQLSKLAEWIRQSKLTGTAENKIYQTGGDYQTLLNGDYILGNNVNFGEVCSTQGGSSYWINKTSKTVGEKKYLQYNTTAISSSGKVYHDSISYYEGDGGFYPSTQTYRIFETDPDMSIIVGPRPPSYLDVLRSSVAGPNWWYDVFKPTPDVETEKREVTYMPPVTWSPPAPTTGQDVYYNPYPNSPNKPIKEIVEDVPKDIYDKKFDPAPPSILDPSVPPIEPPAPDIPPVNPNPDVNPPEEVQPYTVRLGDVFPFCIPFDIYHMVTLFAAEPEAPHAKWEFSLPFTGGTYEIEWDLREWDEVAALCRKLELILFCVGLAVVTSKLIKW